MSSEARTGGKALPGFRIATDNDVYFVKEEADIIFNYLLPHYENINNPVVLDACCNDGVLGKSFEKIIDCKKVEYQDIKKDNKSILNFFPNYKYDIILCNPPWTPVKVPLEIYNHLELLLSDIGILVFVINNVFCYQGWERASKLKYQKYYFLPRFVFKWSSRPLLDCGIMVYHKNNIIPVGASILRPYIDIPPFIDTNFINTKCYDNIWNEYINK